MILSKQISKKQYDVCIIHLADARFYPFFHRQAEALRENGYSVALVSWEKVRGEGDPAWPGIDVYPIFIPSETIGGKLFFLRYMVSLVLVLCRLRAKVYEAVDPPALLPARIAAWVRRCRYNYFSLEYFQGVDSIVGRPLIRFLWYCVERFSIRGAAAVAAVCDTTRQFLQEEYGLASTTTVLNVPAAQEYESGGRPLLRSALGLPGTTPIVIYKGDIAANRGLLTFIKAMTPFDSLHFALIGTGPLTGELSSLAESLGLGKRVHFLGRISSGDFASYIGDADAGQVIHETRGVNMMVTLPSKLFDYIHASVPVIASDGPEIARIVRTWDIGWVVNPASQKSIEEAIAGFCAAFPDLSRYKANCRRAARQFCWENEKKQYLDFIGTSLGTREGPRRPDQRT